MTIDIVMDTCDGDDTPFIRLYDGDRLLVHLDVPQGARIARSDTWAMWITDDGREQIVYGDRVETDSGFEGKEVTVE